MKGWPAAMAAEIDVAAKIPARIREILVHEGDFVTAGQVVVLMDTDSLNARGERPRRSTKARRRAQQLEISGHPLRES